MSSVVEIVDADRPNLPAGIVGTELVPPGYAT